MASATPGTHAPGEASNSLRTWEFGDYTHYAEWPKVADDVIEANLSYELNFFVLHMCVERAPFDSPSHGPYLLFFPPPLQLLVHPAQ